ncbi:DUF2304 domain-containing protein [Treponema saccharophilum]|uniref:DUF2304 domain-containing protein n=1 Tax=Treponema saccharophilum DSM 2985 TaxID=907348 RepID=H7EI29_9SPIR|nr:DUF2304 domain-containing protein [Treponema saccharophilum]EIC02708.1 hypothetical protein TresaDRAFT_2203 [Treponema saccharophilum DSM 2985]BDC96138.1 hypothetical protein TRSA_12370 [Treponema saccharophilum]
MISINLRILLIIVSVIISVISLKLIRKGSLSVKYALFWLSAALILLLVGLIPNQIGLLTKFVGFEATSNFVTGVLLLILLAICLMLTLVVSKLRKSITLLVQELSMLKKVVDDEKK